MVKVQQQRNSDWDPILLIAQIVALQALHYLTLALLAPPMLVIFAEPKSLVYEGGAWSVGMIMDWREMAGRPTVHGLHGQHHRGWDLFDHWMTRNSSGGLVSHPVDSGERIYGVDPMRGWVIAALWLIVSTIDVYYIYTIIRRPKLVLDFSLTLVLWHLILTTYYSESLPTSIFFWAILAAGAAIKTILGEQMCVKREMREGISIPKEEQESYDDMEMGSLRQD